MRKLLCIILCAALLLGLMGCSTVGQIAQNAADAAVKELEEQVKQTLEKNKVEMVQMKTAFGKLNDEGSELQLFCAVLIKSGNEAMVQACVSALGKVFQEAAMQPQTQSKVENVHLVHKDVVFDQSDFSDGTYYVVYGYTSSLMGNLGNREK